MGPTPIVVGHLLNRSMNPQIFCEPANSISAARDGIYGPQAICDKKKELELVRKFPVRGAIDIGSDIDSLLQQLILQYTLPPTTTTHVRPAPVNVAYL